MTDSLFAEHIARLKAATIDGLTLASVAEWIEKNTFLRGRPFSFKDHEFQLRILQDVARDVVVRKCSQIGLSEMSMRAALAITNILQDSTCIYTMPTRTDAQKFVVGRMNPTIASSPMLSQAINPTVDNAEVKQFNASFIYIKGTVGVNAAISVPADVIFNDEVDFSDQEVMSNYTSRLTHSPYKITRKFSTPTVEGWGISAEFDHTKQHWNMVKCNHCNHTFLPDYFKHVHIPGWDKELREITRATIHHTRYLEAQLLCPGCGKQPSLQPQYREWVVRNNEAPYLASGYQIQPFDAPNVISVSDLIMASTKYRRYVDFVNFNLGLPAEDKESSFSRQELEALFVDSAPEGFYLTVAGLDMGLICTLVIAAINAYGQMHVVHTEQIPIGKLEVRLTELWARYRVSLTVMDSQPYADTMMRLQARNPSVFGAVYVTSKDISVYALKMKEKDEEKGTPDMRQVNINRDKGFDGVLNVVRSGSLVIRADSNKETILDHMTDMKRVKAFEQEEITYVWRKSATGDDHFHHAMLYCWVASLLRGVEATPLALPPFPMGKFKMKNPV